jgi:hypothetical protein
VRDVAGLAENAFSLSQHIWVRETIAAERMAIEPEVSARASVRETAPLDILRMASSSGRNR